MISSIGTSSAAGLRLAITMVRNLIAHTRLVGAVGQPHRAMGLVNAVLQVVATVLQKFLLDSVKLIVGKAFGRKHGSSRKV